MRPALAALLLFLSCSGETPEPEALPLRRDVVCSVDGMILMDYAGPKAQMVHLNGNRSYFCDTREAFEAILRAVAGRRVRSVWFQTLDSAPWEAHADGWEPGRGHDGEGLCFVAGSARRGAMGPTLAPFSRRGNADAFAAAHGGTVYTFDEIDEAVLEALKKQAMSDL